MVGFALAGLAMAGCLYDPAFATLHGISGPSYRKAVTALTLFGGFASTVFWPLSQFLLDTVRLARDVRHLRGAESRRRACRCTCGCCRAGPGNDAPRARRPRTPRSPRGRANPAVFVWLATALALASFLSSALSAHVIGLLTSSGLTARDAVLVSSLIGPMQVAGRVAEFAFGAHLRPLTVGTLAFGLFAVALLLLTQVHGLWIAALWFAAMYGWSNGVMTIVRGTVPGELFGHRQFGALLGRLARPQFVAKAIAPLALTLVFAVDPARTLSLYALAAHRPRGARRLSAGVARECARARRALTAWDRWRCDAVHGRRRNRTRKRHFPERAAPLRACPSINHVCERGRLGRVREARCRLGWLPKASRATKQSTQPARSRRV